MSDTPSSLQNVRDDQLFERGIAYVRQSSGGIKRVNSQELAHLNSLLTESSDDPWRFQPTQIRIGGGQLHHFNIVSNPVQRARELCGDAVQRAGNGDAAEAALNLYIELILSHLFKEANRRTAALASLWVLEHAGLSVDPQTMIKIPIGNLREPSERAAFEARFRDLID